MNTVLSYELDRLRAQLAAIERERTGSELEELAAIRLRADAVAALYGEKVSSASLGETPLQYRRRLAQGFAKHSPRFKGESLAGVGSAALAEAERVIYADAAEAARATANDRPGLLFAEQTRDESGRLVTKFHGDPMAWMQNFCIGAAVGHVIDPRKS